MSSRVRKRPLGWRRKDPVGGGPKREIQITEHACSKSAIYLLWTRVFAPPALPPPLERPTFQGGSLCISGENFPRPGDGVADTTPRRLRFYPEFEVFRTVVVLSSVAMMHLLTRQQISSQC